MKKKILVALAAVLLTVGSTFAKQYTVRYICSDGTVHYAIVGGVNSAQEAISLINGADAAILCK